MPSSARTPSRGSGNDRRRPACDVTREKSNVMLNCLNAGETCRSHLDGRSRRTCLNSPAQESDRVGHDDARIQDGDRSHAGSRSHLPEGPQRQVPLKIMSPVPRVGDAPIERFEAYVEDNLGSLAPSLRPNRGHPNDQGRNQAETAQLPYLSPPSPPIHHVEIDMTARETLEWEKQMEELDDADMEYLKAKGAFDLPPRQLQQKLIDAHFFEVHPTAPVVNRSQFLSDLHDGKTQSRLLLFAIFTSGSRACRDPALLDQQGSNHTSARRFYQATKALLDTGYERDRLVRVQALLLITWWWDKKDDGGRNMRSCAVDAINTAQSLGMHRWDQYPRSDRVLLGLWKRIWWSCVNRDVGVAVAHGLPCMLTLSDFDVHPLTYEDFDEGPVHSPSDHRHEYSETEIVFMIEQCKVSEALRHIHDRYFVKQHLQRRMTGSIASREVQITRAPILPGQKCTSVACPDEYQDQGLMLCRTWLKQVPKAVRYNTDDAQGHRFWPAFLHLLYFTNIMLRFRETSVSPATNGRGIAERQYCRTRGIAAATMVSKIIRNMRAHGHILRCTGQLTNTLFNCLIFFLIEARSPSYQVRQDARHKYTLCLNQLYEFSQLWISASLIHRLFESLQANMLSFNNKLPSGQADQQGHELFPGHRTSSELTQTHVTQLLETDFYFIGSSFGDLAGNTWMQSTPEDIMSDSDPPHLLVGGLPDTLDVDAWLDFFDHGYGDPSWLS